MQVKTKKEIELDANDVKDAIFQMLVRELVIPSDCEEIIFNFLIKDKTDGSIVEDHTLEGVKIIGELRQ